MFFSCIFSLALDVPAECRSSAADEVDYLDIVARLDHGRCVFRFGHDLTVDLDRHAAFTRAQPLEQRDESNFPVDGVGIAVESNCSCYCVGHQKAASGGEAALARPRTPRLWLPYAGITRIRFEGFSGWSS